MKKNILSLLLIVSVIISSSAIGQMNMQLTKSNTSPSAFQLKTGMRQLWEDHVTWTRNVILCLTDNLPGTDQAVKRLLKNQDDIGNAIAPYYGDAAAKK